MTRNSGFAVAVAVVAFGFLSSGCATSSAVKKEVDNEVAARNPGLFGTVKVYGKDRFNDLTDILMLDLAFGRGFGVNVRPTEYLQLGIGWFDGIKVGTRQRAFGLWDESKVERGASAWYWLEVDRQARWGTRTLFEQNYDYTGWDIWEDHTSRACERDWSDVGASLMFLVVGADVDISPVQLFDFVAGIFTVDVSHDDTWYQVKEELVKERGIEE